MSRYEVKMDFEKVYKDYKDKLFRFTYNYTKNIDEQDDLLQDIFYSIFISLKNFKNKSSINTYIYTIARNVCMKFIKNNIKDRIRSENLTKNYEERYEESAQKIYEMSEDLKYFFEVLEKFPEGQKEVFYFSEIENLKYEEIAKIVEIPSGTVKSRLNRVKVKIVQELSKED